ncbi:MAG TPA: GntR family transcriptional regulator [Myxococcales bacterium]|nr:GntR family transcriptional regulator [Myxococcales bacterium]
MTVIDVGRMNCLRVVRIDSDALILEAPGDNSSNVLLPNRNAQPGLELGDQIDVFVYSDSQGRYLATVHPPTAMLGEIAYLKVLEINQTGAFLDWGLPKDLLLPYSEQKDKLGEGRSCIVFLHKDNHAERVVASQRLKRHIGTTPASYEPGEEVNITVVKRTDLGYTVVVNHRHWGLLYENEIFEPLNIGMKTTAWVKKVVGDGKVDLNLSPPIKQRYSDASERILFELETAGGFLPLHDKSSPEAIYGRLEMSKKNFKAGVGKLYKTRKITLQPDGISLAKAQKDNA